MVGHQHQKLTEFQEFAVAYTGLLNYGKELKHCPRIYFSCFFFHVTNYDASNTIRVNILSSTCVTYLLMHVLSDSLLFIYNNLAVQLYTLIWGAVITLTLTDTDTDFIYLTVGAVAVWCGLGLGR